MHSTSPEGGSIRRVADIDVTNLTDALRDGGDTTAWWYDPAAGEVEMRLPAWAGLGDEDEEDDDPCERGLVLIQPAGSRAAYRDMVRFAESVTDAHASDLLARALEGRGAFRRFRDTLHEFPDLVEHWHSYSRAADERRSIDWLLGRGYVDPVDAEAERAGRTATMTAALDAISPPDTAEFDEAELPGRWDEVQALIDAGRAVTIHRAGQPWAVISPQPQQHHLA